jgi:hypothetical protein
LKGNIDFVVHDDGYYFLPAISWSEITSSVTSFRYYPEGFTFNYKGMCAFPRGDISKEQIISLCNSSLVKKLIDILNPSLSFGVGNFRTLPATLLSHDDINDIVNEAISLSKKDWDSYELSWNHSGNPLIGFEGFKICDAIKNWRDDTVSMTFRLKELEEINNSKYCEKYSLHKDVKIDVDIKMVSLIGNPSYKYEGRLSESENEERFILDTSKELISYAIGCMMGRYNLDAPGLIYANSGNEGFDASQYTTFPADDDGIIPLTDAEWFADDAANRVEEFISVAWPASSETGNHLEENLDFLAANLSPKKSESSRDTIRRYLCDKFYKDHLQTYKKRPIYWLFSSGKQKAFQCLVYLHRYNESTLARMRTEYVIPLSAKLYAYVSKLEQDIEASTSTAETKRLEKEVATLHKQQTELAEFDEKLRHYADQRISLDLDDGVKVNYGRFGDLLAEVKAVTGQK